VLQLRLRRQSLLQNRVRKSSYLGCCAVGVGHLAQQDIPLVHMGSQLYLKVIKVMPVAVLQLPQLHCLGSHLNVYVQAFYDYSLQRSARPC
jgi:hypothetical protein